MRVNTKSAKGDPEAMPVRQAVALLRFLPTVLFARMSGAYRSTPFFTADGAPVAQRRVLTEQEHEAVMSAVG